MIYRNHPVTGRALADFFNKHFIGSSAHASSYITSEDIGHSRAESIFLQPTDQAEVYRTFMSLNNSKALDIDNIQIKPIKYILEYITAPLTYIFNLSIESGEFPAAMKKSRVSVIYKGGDKNLPKNYRPISIIPTFAKGFEKILHYRFNQFFEKNHLISDAQFGFRKGRSTELALLGLKEHVLQNIQMKLITLGLFIDFSKAFDSLDHGILTHKLSVYGIRGNPLSLIKSYLADRQQCVYIRNHQSSLLPIIRGVPQGSVLGPLLFNVYLNSIVNIDQGLKFIIYADDCTILFSGPDVNELVTKCNQLLNRLREWSDINLLKINPAKTKLCYFVQETKIFV